jgi:hypothetical protein
MYTDTIVTYIFCNKYDKNVKDMLSYAAKKFNMGQHSVLVHKPGFQQEPITLREAG